MASVSSVTLALISAEPRGTYLRLPYLSPTSEGALTKRMKYSHPRNVPWMTLRPSSLAKSSKPIGVSRERKA